MCLTALLVVQMAATMGPAADPTIPHQSNFYHFTFTRFEPFPLYANAAFFIGLTLFLIRPTGASAALLRIIKAKNLSLVIALGVLVVTCVGRFVAHQNFDLCIDEYLNEFETKILEHHHLVATIPPEWRGYENALALPYVHYNEDHGYWASEFLPGFASLDFVFDALHLDFALSPVLAAASILLLARLADRAFPEQEGLAGGVAILLLACCPQFLAMAMTKFAWTAHLAGSLLWVWLFTHPNRRVFLLTPILGVLLIGLHQPHVHLLVAAPFLLRLLLNVDWKALIWFGLWYLAGCWAWYQVMLILRPSSHGEVAELHYLSFPLILTSVLATFHAITLLAWCTPVMVPFLFMMVGSWKEQPAAIPSSRDVSRFFFISHSRTSRGMVGASVTFIRPTV
jgi:hypothetical protein